MKKRNMRCAALGMLVTIMITAGCDRPADSKPADADLKAYLEKQLPGWLKITSFESKPFINQQTREGRISIAGKIKSSEALYRLATEEEKKAAVAKAGLSQQDVRTGEPDFDYAHTLVVVAHAAGTEFDETAEVECREQVQGWSLSGAFDLSNIDGVDKSKLPGNALVLRSAQAEQLFREIGRKSKQIKSEQAQFFRWFEHYFEAGARRHGCYQPHNSDALQYPFTLTFTGDAKLRQDGFSMAFEVQGSLHWDKEIPLVHTFQGTQQVVLKFGPDVRVRVRGRMAKMENGKLSGDIGLCWRPEDKTDAIPDSHVRVSDSECLKTGPVWFEALSYPELTTASTPPSPTAALGLPRTIKPDLEIIASMIGRWSRTQDTIGYEFFADGTWSTSGVTKTPVARQRFTVTAAVLDLGWNVPHPLDVIDVTKDRLQWRDHSEVVSFSRLGETSGQAVPDSKTRGQNGGATPAQN